MTQPSTSPSDSGYEVPPPAPATPEKASLLDDFMDIFYAPSSVFARRENASFWVPLLIVSVLLGLAFFANRDLMEPIMEAEMQRSMAASGQQLTPEQMEAARRFTTGIGSVTAFLFPPIAILMIGVVVWGVGKFFDARQTLNAALVVAAFSYVPRVVEGIVNRVQGLVVDPSTLDHRYSLSLGPGRFLDPDTASPVLLGLVGRLDVFTLWVTVLIAIGLAVTGKISRGKAAVAAAIVWVIGALPTIAAALRQ
ncbi:MAG: Yip1 protein [Geminicoccaceae bacterium]|nr:Yip1 protein [Geminicoccaceae bacterium]